MCRWTGRKCCSTEQCRRAVASEDSLVHEIAVDLQDSTRKQVGAADADREHRDRVVPPDCVKVPVLPRFGRDRGAPGVVAPSRLREGPYPSSPRTRRTTTPGRCQGCRAHAAGSVTKNQAAAKTVAPPRLCKRLPARTTHILPERRQTAATTQVVRTVAAGVKAQEEVDIQVAGVAQKVRPAGLGEGRRTGKAYVFEGCQQLAVPRL